MPTLTGQDAQFSLIADLLSGEKFPSGLLVSGPRGSGKKTLAKLIAQGLLCEEKRFGDGCACPSCRKTAEGNHPDVHWIGLDEEAYSIKIEEIRRLIDQTNLKPYEASRKVFILVGSERMPEEASNAFLKTLEEPPQSTHFILLAANPFNLRETLLSRCIRIKMAALPFEILKNILEREQGLDPVQAGRLARSSQGCLGKALELRNEDSQGLRAFFEKELLPNPDAALEKWIGKKRSELLRLLDFFALFLRDRMIWQETGTREFLYDDSPGADTEGRGRCFGTEALLSMLELVDETRNALEENANPKIALFRLGVRLNELKMHGMRK